MKIHLARAGIAWVMSVAVIYTHNYFELTYPSTVPVIDGLIFAVAITYLAKIFEG